MPNINSVHILHSLNDPFHMNWQTVMLMCLNGSKSLQQVPKCDGKPETRRAEAVTALMNICSGTTWTGVHILLAVYCHLRNSSYAEDCKPEVDLSREQVVLVSVFDGPAKNINLHLNSWDSTWLLEPCCLLYFILHCNKSLRYLMQSCVLVLTNLTWQ